MTFRKQKYECIKAGNPRLLFFELVQIVILVYSPLSNHTIYIYQTKMIVLPFHS